jgi:hypothetical protein
MRGGGQITGMGGQFKPERGVNMVRNLQYKRKIRRPLSRKSSLIDYQICLRSGNLLVNHNWIIIVNKIRFGN